MARIPQWGVVNAESVNREEWDISHIGIRSKVRISEV
jgi:hypothetical protein